MVDGWLRGCQWALNEWVAIECGDGEVVGGKKTPSILQDWSACLDGLSFQL